MDRFFFHYVSYVLTFFLPEHVCNLSYKIVRVYIILESWRIGFFLK